MISREVIKAAELLDNFHPGFKLNGDKSTYIEVSAGGSNFKVGLDPSDPGTVNDPFVRLDISGTPNRRRFYSAEFSRVFGDPDRRVNPANLRRHEILWWEPSLAHTKMHEILTPQNSKCRNLDPKDQKYSKLTVALALATLIGVGSTDLYEWWYEKVYSAGVSQGCKIVIDTFSAYAHNQDQIDTLSDIKMQICH